MLKPGEIQKIANRLGIRDTQIEKDYVIGWILRGISINKYLKERLIFKGGTSLRKIYFPDYRLSEDLDFTFKGEDFNAEEIKKKFGYALPDMAGMDDSIEVESVGGRAPRAVFRRGIRAGRVSSKAPAGRRAVARSPRGSTGRPPGRRARRSR